MVSLDDLRAATGVAMTPTPVSQPTRRTNGVVARRCTFVSEDLRTNHIVTVEFSTGPVAVAVFRATSTAPTINQTPGMGSAPPRTVEHLPSVPGAAVVTGNNLSFVEANVVVSVISETNNESDPDLSRNVAPVVADELRRTLRP